MRACLFGLMTVCVLLALSSVGLAQGLNTTSTALPPDGVYISPDAYHTYSAMGLTVVLDNPEHRPLVTTTVRLAFGPSMENEQEYFDSVLDVTEVGMGLGPLHFAGPVAVNTYGRNLSATGTFSTEMISMTLTGNTPYGPALIRESPTRASTGEVVITEIDDDYYHIDSFFDVFTELSLDGGQTWIPCDTSTRMTLSPEPGMLSLLLLGGLTLLWRRR